MKANMVMTRNALEQRGAIADKFAPNQARMNTRLRQQT
jgi:hypothetical protein